MDEIRRQIEARLQEGQRRIEAGVERWPTLANLMGAWFHQDVDLEGSTSTQVVAAYLRVTPMATVAALVEEVVDYLDTDQEARPTPRQLGAGYLWSADYESPDSWLTAVKHQAASWLASKHDSGRCFALSAINRRSPRGSAGPSPGAQPNTTAPSREARFDQRHV